MVWQDIVMALCCLGFGYALIPQVKYCWKAKTVDLSWQTIIITTIALWMFVISITTLGLWFTSLMNAISASCWTILWWMKWAFEKKT